MTLRVVLAGAGMISHFHLLAWRAARAEVVAVADPDLSRARQRADTFGIPRIYADARDMLERERPDALDVASPRQAHAALVRLAAARGVPVLCQKPLCPTLAESEALAADVAGRIRLMVHENWRFRPYYRLLKAWIAEGRIGVPTSLSILHRSSGFLPGPDGRLPQLVRRPSMAQEERLLVAETLIHHLDVARWLMGPLAMLAARRQRLVQECLGETAAALMLATPDGVPVFVEGHGAAPGLPPRARDEVTLIGTRATASFDGMILRLLGEAPEEHVFEHETAYQESFNACIAHFVACLRDGTLFETGPEDNLKTLKLVEAAYAA